MPYKALKLIALQFFITIIGFSQQLKLDAKLDTSKITVGEQTRLTITAQYPGNFMLLPPPWKDTLSAAVEIIGVPRKDTTGLKAGNNLTTRYSLTITAFDSGYYVIQPQKFYLKNHQGSLIDSSETPALLLSVYTIPVDTTKAIKDIKGPISVPASWRDYLPWILAVIITLIIVFAFWYYFVKIRKPKKEVQVRYKPNIPPFEIAIKELKQLQQEKLWQQGLVKDYHSRLTEILRRYIEDAFDIEAVEMTSSHLLEKAEHHSILRQNMMVLKRILELADLVKFAKANPLPDENDKSFTDCVELIKIYNRLQKEEQNSIKEKTN